MAHKKTYDNSLYFDQETGRIIYPGTKGEKGSQHIRGFLNGNFKEEPLKPGTIIDRYGDNNNGQYFSPDGSSYESRALPPFMKDKPYERYKVVKEFKVDAGTVAPWFDEKGLGTQYYTDYKIRGFDGNLYDANIENLKRFKYIKLLKEGE
ncbi:TNT domain-containing protein [Pseudogracilibacillus sp. SE30717A]|uniref:TNT domain-containing protein n=1 Tax=Pseudogracilibacillus sp. SE30717A TaxID=3098293 RepID=UPI00300DECF2